MDRSSEMPYRAQLFYDAVKKEKRPDRIPIFSNAWNWKIFDAGYTLSEALYDFKKETKAIEHYFREYPTDCMYETGTRNPFSFTQYFGSDKDYIIDDEKQIMSYLDKSYLDASEYDELILDPNKFIWEKLIPRKCHNIQKGRNGKTYIEGTFAFIKYVVAYNNLGPMLAKKFGAVTLYDASAPFYLMVGPDILVDFFRGIKGVSVDMRRMPEKVKAACLALDSVYEPDMSAYAGPDGHNTANAFDGVMAFLAHTIFSAKQFDTFFMPYIRKAADFAAAHDKTVLIFSEGSAERLYDLYRDLPAGYFCILPETDDVFKMKKELPNICIAGGMPSSILRSKSPEECVEYAKKLCDEMGADGGYIFSQDKMLSMPSDCRPENMKATCEFVYSYRL